MLEAELPLREKIPVAWALRNEIESTPDGEVPDIDAVFEGQGADDSEALATARDDLVEIITSILTRAFRSSFLIAAALALVALIPILLVAARSRPTAAARRPSLGPIIAAGLVTGAAVGFVVAEWNRGAGLRPLRGGGPVHGVTERTQATASMRPCSASHSAD